MTENDWLVVHLNFQLISGLDQNSIIVRSVNDS